MSANPILAQSVRGNWVENRHRGAVCVSDSEGRILASVGDVTAEIFPRSAIKSMQALAIFRSAANAKFAMSDEAIALACASHNGELVHTELAASVLANIKLDEHALECGAHPPIDPAARKALFAKGGKPSALHNACSGKHAGMLSVAQAMGVDTKGYSAREHEVQKAVRACVQEVLDYELTDSRCGIDGCSIPTWAAPMNVFAKGFARMATGKGLSQETAAAARMIFNAATSHPFLIGGTGSFDSEAMAAFGGRLMLKFGADGLYCGALRDSGIGFALKCDDGSVPAATAMVAALLMEIAEPTAEQARLLETRMKQDQINWAGHHVGYLEATEAARIRL